ncbi:hypothetical protein DNTS_016950, partial [Danionella cerebrum]
VMASGDDGGNVKIQSGNGRAGIHDSGCFSGGGLLILMMMMMMMMNLLLRSSLLFSIGVGLSLLLNLLQTQRNVTLFPAETGSQTLRCAWWVPACCGAAAALIGLLYPCLDRCVGEPLRLKSEWSSVIRCLAVFVGINHASAVSSAQTRHARCIHVFISKPQKELNCVYKLECDRRRCFVPSLTLSTQKVDFVNNVQLSLTLGALSIGLWWSFDRSRQGLGLGVAIALLATMVTQLLVYNGLFQYTSPDFLYIRSWLPCIFFAGVITVGNIGRQLALYQHKVKQDKSHQD